jgi:predicted TIM-barrel fold metal-dependent hydrolase
MIIDTHSQIWTKEAVASMPEKWLAGYRTIFGDKGFPSIEDTLRDMDEAGVEKAVIVAIDAETTTGFKVPNELVAEIVAQHPDRFIGFAGVDPHKGLLALKELEHAVKDLGLRGLKFIHHLLELCPNDPKMYPIYAKAQELEIPVLFHTGNQFHTGTKLKYCLPIYLDEVAVDFPNLKIIMAHFGFPWVGEAIAIIQRNPNVYFNIAGWAPRHLPEMLIRYMDSVISHKALFGSDFPLVSRKRIIQELKDLPLKEETRRRLLTENPKRLLKLP